jgi:hypothetical protein
MVKVLIGPNMQTKPCIAKQIALHIDLVALKRADSMDAAEMVCVAES